MKKFLHLLTYILGFSGIIALGTGVGGLGGFFIIMGGCLIGTPLFFALDLPHLFKKNNTHCKESSSFNINTLDDQDYNIEKITQKPQTTYLKRNKNKEDNQHTNNDNDLSL